MRLKPRPLRSRLLVLAPWVVAFHMFAWPHVHHWLDPVAKPMPDEWRWELTTEELWATFPGPIMAVGTFLVVGFLIGFFVMGGYIGLYSVAARIYPTEVRTTGIGWTIGVGRFGSIVGPYLGGILIALEWSTGPRFLMFAVPLVVAAIAAFAINARELAVQKN